MWPHTLNTQSETPAQASYERTNEHTANKQTHSGEVQQPTKSKLSQSYVALESEAKFAVFKHILSYIVIKQLYT